MKCPNPDCKPGVAVDFILVLAGELLGMQKAASDVWLCSACRTVCNEKTEFNINRYVKKALDSEDLSEEDIGINGDAGAFKRKSKKWAQKGDSDSFLTYLEPLDSEEEK